VLEKFREQKYWFLLGSYTKRKGLVELIILGTGCPQFSGLLMMIIITTVISKVVSRCSWLEV